MRPSHDIYPEAGSVRSLGVAVSHPDPGISDELVHAVEAESDLYLALDPSKAAVVLASGGELGGLARSAGQAALVGVAAEREVADVAREALRYGAHEIVVWPRDRAGLRTIVREAASRARIASGHADGRVVAVCGARGGAGTTTIAAMLARASEAPVVDLETTGAGQSAFLADGAEPTLSAVLSAVDDLDPSSVVAAMSAHAAGRAICTSARSEAPGDEQALRLLDLLRAAVPLTVVDVGRGVDAATRAAAASADVVLCVCAPDVAALRGVRALIDEMGSRVEVMLNRSARFRLHPRDIERVAGRPPIAVVPNDPRVRRAGESGRLPHRGNATRVIEGLAERIGGDAHGS